MSDVWKFFCQQCSAKRTILTAVDIQELVSKKLTVSDHFRMTLPMPDHTILWSFRRCPYAMRARLAVLSSGLRVELREIRLRDKPAEFLKTSATGTVPALRQGAFVLDESLDIMIWSLRQSDPENLLAMPQQGWDLIAANDGPFKAALDHTKYSVRYPNLNPEEERKKAAQHLSRLDEQLAGQGWLFANRPTLADFALLPFVRQFAHIDREWFYLQPWPNLIDWLDRFLASERFASIMPKYSPWTPEDSPIWFSSQN